MIQLLENQKTKARLEEEIKVLNSRIQVLERRETVTTKALKEFHDNKLLLHKAQELSRTGSWHIYVRRGEQFLSPSMRDIYGINKDTITLEEGINRTHPDDRDSAELAYKKAVEGHPTALEYRIIRSNGEIRTVYSPPAHLVRDGNNHVIEIIGVTQDITAQVLASAKLNQLQKAIEISIDGIAISDMDGYIKYVNGAWATAHEYSREELIDKHFRVFHTEQQMKDEVIPFNERLKKTGGHTGEVSHKTRSGKTFPTHMSTTVIKNENGDPVGMIAICRDISDRIMAENALRRSRDMLNALLNANYDAAFLADNKFRILALNDNFAARFGKRAEELVGKNVKDLLPPDIAERRLELLRDTLFRGKPVDIEDEREGRILFSSYRPILDEQGKMISAAVFCRDITEKRRVEEQLKKTERGKAEIEKLAAVGRMTARVAHEINNPLSGIKSSFALIKNAVPEHHEHHQFVDLIDKEINRISRIVRQMVELYAPLTKEAREFKIKPAIQDVITLIKSESRYTNLDIRLVTCHSSASVVMNEDWLRQILFNIIRNAAEASPEDKVVRIKADVCDTRLIITVSDHGSGIPDEMRPKIYEPFFSTKNSSETGGLGLGLSISKGLVDAMRGKMKFRCGLKAGTVFWIDLPFDYKDSEGESE